MALNLHQKINLIQKNITSVFKGGKVSITATASYRAVLHDDVAALLHLPMADAGIAVEVDMVDCQVEQIVNEKTYQGNTEKKISYMAKVWMAVTFVNADDPKDRFTVKSFAYAFDNGDKAVGKAESMAVKYVYLKNFNLESTDDEESRDHEPSHINQGKQSFTDHSKTSAYVNKEPSEQQRKAIFAISKSKNIEMPKIDSFEQARDWITAQNNKK